MGGKGHRWEKEGPHKKDKYPTPKPDVSEFMKKVSLSAGKIGADNDAGKWDSEAEHAAWEKVKEEHAKNENIPERVKHVREQTEKEKEEAKEKRAHEKKQAEEKRRAQAQAIMRGLRPGKIDNGFYGHVQASDFKKTSIVNTTGRVR